MSESEEPAEKPNRGWLSRRNFLIGGSSALAAGGIVAACGGLPRIPGVQEYLIYHPESDFTGKKLPELGKPEDYGLEGIRAETLSTKDGHEFLLWHSEEMDSAKQTLLFFPGNAGHFASNPDIGPKGIELGGDGSDYLTLLKAAREKGFQVAFAMPVGFAGSNTSPTQEKMFAGAEATIDWLLDKDIAPRNLKICGLSMGTTLAARAANYLSKKEVFTANPTQHIDVTLVNGIIDVPAGISDLTDPVQGFYADRTFTERLDTGAELEGIDRKHGKRVHVTFLRGQDDEVTKEAQIADHAEASDGLDFKSKTVPGKHYPDPQEILNSFERSRGR